MLFRSLLAGLVVPPLADRGTGVVVWALLVGALAILARRRPISPRMAVAALAIGVGFVWLVVGVREGHPPPVRDAALVVGALLAAGILGSRAPFLLPLALIPGPREAWTASGATPKARDVLIISIDTLRLDAARAMTAFQDGAFFEAQAPAPWTLPSLATLQTGVLPARHGAGRVEGGFSGNHATTLAERFAAAGWDTAATVESPFTDARFGLTRGFARVRSGGARPWVLPRSRFGDSPHPTGSLLLGLLVGLPDGGVEARLADLKELVAERRDRPLFVWVHILDVHLPYRHAGSLDASAADRARLATAHRLSLGHPDAATLGLLRRAYAHEVEVVDTAVTAMRTVLPDAITVITADHGEELGEHGGFEHGHSFYQELLGIPLLVDSLPLAPSGPVGLQDVAPTLLAAAGLPTDGLDGRNLADPTPRLLPSINLLYGPLDARAVRIGAHKLVDQAGLTSFDLATDPAERNPGTDATLAPLLPSPALSGTVVPLDDTRDALRALGYLE